jgi:hypothetical protein
LILNFNIKSIKIYINFNKYSIALNLLKPIRFPENCITLYIVFLGYYKNKTYLKTLKFMARFGDVLRADELKAQKTAYEDWLKLPTAAKQAAYAASVLEGGGKRLRVGSRRGYVKLFGSDDGYVACKLLSSTQNLTGDATTGETDAAFLSLIIAAVIGDAKYATTTKPSASGNSILSGANLQGKLAKVTLKKSDATKKERTSRFLKSKYKAPSSNSASCAFGALIGGTATTGTYTAATEALRTALILPDSVGLSIRFTPQGNIGIE